ncbi:MAG: VCBS repeat-containing protein, partial [Anaerolineales bacterium]|nr:VCBS repeat-containing protein [Anaerolineales bacterium]
MLFNSNGTTLRNAYEDILIDDVYATVAWGDIDNDGDLDLAIGRVGLENLVYENDAGTLRFDLDNGWGWQDSYREATYDVSWGDWDNDGDLDLAVANSGIGGQRNRVYENVNGWLYNIPANNLGWTADNNAGTASVDWGDYDGDGDLDLAVANGIKLKDFFVLGSYILEPNVVYENDNGTLNLDPLNGYGWVSPESYPSRVVRWGDWDNDGDLDLLTINSFYSDDPLDSSANLDNYAFSNQIYENVNGELKLDPSAGYGWKTANELATFAGEWGDVDNDGDLDIAFGNGGDLPNELYINRLYNDTKQANHQPHFYVGQPAGLPKANGSGANLLTDTIIPIPYMITDPDGDSVGQIKAYYSPNKGGSWSEAQPQNETTPIHLSQNYGLSFNGFSSYVSVPDSDEINRLAVSERTIMVWF